MLVIFVYSLKNKKKYHPLLYLSWRVNLIVICYNEMKPKLKSRKFLSIKRKN